MTVANLEAFFSSRMCIQCASSQQFATSPTDVEVDDDANRSKSGQARKMATHWDASLFRCSFQTVVVVVSIVARFLEHGYFCEYGCAVT